MNRIPGMAPYWVEAERVKRKLVAYGVWRDTATACECVKRFPIFRDYWEPAMIQANDYRDKLNREAKEA